MVTTGAYLDYLSTTPCLPAVVEAMKPFFTTDFYNPQSSHDLGNLAMDAISKARNQLASLFNTYSGNDFVFTSGATEANNWVLRSHKRNFDRNPGHIITTQIEHLSIIQTCRSLENQGTPVTYLPVDQFGCLDPDSVKKSIRPNTTLVSVQQGNTEIGTVQPILEISKICRAANVPFHVDGAVSAGNMPVDLQELDVDMMTISPHMFYGPKGIGVLYMRKGIKLAPLLEGGNQEKGTRAGTENVPAIVGAGVAASEAQRLMRERLRHYTSFRDILLKSFTDMDGVALTGHPTARLPHHASCLVEQVEAESLLLSLNLSEAIYASSGTACSGEEIDLSYVIEAIGAGGSRSGSLVFGIGLGTTKNEMDCVVRELGPTIERLKALSPQN